MDLLSSESGHILLVGSSNSAREMQTLLSANSWQCTRSDTASGVLRRLRTESRIDLVVMLPGWSLDQYTELCREIKLDERTAFVSVVFALPVTDTADRAAVLEARADDCIQLPASPAEILLRVSNAVRAKRATDSLEDATAVITSLGNAIEGRDAYTGGHVERVSVYSVEIGKRVGVDTEGLAALKTGGVVHDIGKVAVPDHVLNKVGRLTDVEMEIVKRHPIIGYDILQPLRTFRDVLPIVRWHHERPNGTGYPDGLKGDQLPLLPRIATVADCFDAISTRRPYRPALPPEKCREILSQAAENEDLDSSVVKVLLGILDEMAPVPAAAVGEWAAG